MKKLLVLLFISQVSIFTIFSQSGEDNNLSHYIGGAAGFSTGYGLSYRYWPGDYGTQIVFTPISNDYQTSINLGTAVLKNLHVTKYTRLFLYLAGNGTYKRSKREVYNEESKDWEETGFEQDFTGTVGIGPGLELYLFRNIVIDVMFGFSLGTGGLGFTAETALYYRF